jgi:hypothetical protein
MIEFLMSEQALNIIQSLGVLVGIGFTISQMKKNNKVARSQIFNNVYQRLDTINSLALEEKITERYFTEYDPKKHGEDPFNSYIDMVGTFFYEMYFHHNNGLLSKKEWETWDETIRKFYRYPYVRGYWEQNRREPGNGFDTYVAELVK